MKLYGVRAAIRLQHPSAADSGSSVAAAARLPGPAGQQRPQLQRDRTARSARAGTAESSAAQPARRRQQGEPLQESVQRDRSEASRSATRLHPGPDVRRHATVQRYRTARVSADPAAAAKTSAFSHCVSVSVSLSDSVVFSLMQWLLLRRECDSIRCVTVVRLLFDAWKSRGRAVDARRLNRSRVVVVTTA